MMAHIVFDSQEWLTEYSFKVTNSSNSTRLSPLESTANLTDIFSHRGIHLSLSLSANSSLIKTGRQAWSISMLRQISEVEEGM